ncbi:zinc-binding protein [Duganella sp. FT92W]|uniref:Zinc-binding protein n=1 Tax=Pseudoduganella rivuli TaxID=2666085 RepID=A0A7X2LS92_9BURK|nr:toprim domain-containing protein [Pseudoduganella rivuli]MRV70559.1 zinc-binding protein [Pseudoduganella rivuli]
MNRIEYEARYEEMLVRAHGRWTSLLLALGIDKTILNRRNQPCPVNGCGGIDRFQYTDKFGEGNYHCRKCGPGGGFKLLCGVQQLRAGEALRRIEGAIGYVNGPPVDTAQRLPGHDKMRALARKIWAEAEPLRHGDECTRYLARRGLELSEYPATLRFHPSLGYYVDGGNGKPLRVRDYPALLASVQGPEGEMITLHRTYLSNGWKAPLHDAKKLLSSGIDGAAIRLGEPSTELDISEGLENGLAVFKRTGGHPVWSALNAGNMRVLWIPQSVERLRIYGDNDADGDFSGQASAYILAQQMVRRRVNNTPIRVEVFIPKKAGTDWASVWLASLKRIALAA